LNKADEARASAAEQGGREHIYRGSRKHVLDWSSRPTFAAELRRLVDPIGCEISTASEWMPRGYAAPDEARLETFGPRVMPTSEAWITLRKWWLAHERGANTPNWDIAMSCEIEGKQGLILVEAKANVPELGASCKSFTAEEESPSGENHRQIGAAIDEARAALRELGTPTSITRDTHYQLSNRVAFAWKLASLGIPTVLVYLGFLGDDGIKDAGPPFTDEAHWRGVFGAYAHGIVPESTFERRIDCGAAPFWLLVRSRAVLQLSPARRGETPNDRTPARAR
jgi:hypothetical protein